LHEPKSQPYEGVSALSAAVQFTSKSGSITRWIAALRPTDRLAQIRWLFLLFCLGSAAVLAGVLVGAATAGQPTALAVALLLPLLGCKWFEEYRGRSFHFGWDVLEAAALLAVGTAAGNPLIILLLIYARLALSALTASVRRAMFTTGAYSVSFAGAIVFTSPNWGVGTQTIPYIFLASGFFIVSPVMHLFSESLRRLAEATHRDRALRDAMMQLGSAVTVDEVCRAAEPAMQRLFADPTVRVKIAETATAESLTREQREQLHRAGVELRGPAVPLLWGTGGSPPPALLAIAMSTTGLVLIGSDPLQEADRLAAAMLVEHLSVQLEAATLREIGERRRIEAVVRESEENFRHLFERNPQPMWLYDAETFRILAVNDAAVSVYGYTRAEFLAMPADALDVEEAAGRRHQLKDGRLIDVEIDSSTVSFQGRDAVLLLARDVTEQHVLQRRLEHNALHDPLTGLPNQLLLRNRIRRALARTSRRKGRLSAMLVFDLDGFKTVNDTLGHALGDRVIAIVAARLASGIKGTDTAARLGGDEFAVLLEETGGVDDATAVAHRLLNDIRLPITVQRQTVVVSASVGVAVSNIGNRTVEDLLGDADIAMSVAKGRAAGACVLFDPVFRTALLDRINLQRELSEAVTLNQLSVVYQPQIELATGRVVAVEALCRWQHPQRGAISPDIFIPAAEQTGIITTIDTWVLRTACMALRGWFDEGLPPMRVAVNLSGRDLESDDLVQTVREALAESMLEPWRLELELTETVAVSQAETAIARLEELRALGVRIAIDDVGTGFSMCSRLREMPIDRLKIDRSFVTDISRDDDARTIVGSTVAMGHALGLDLIAEGVESGESAEILRALHCDGAQGFHFSRPLPARELAAWLHAHTTAPALERSAV